LELKARHARRAIHDDLTQDVVTPARGFLGQRRPKDLTGYLGLQVAHAARLCDQLLAELLLRVEGGWLGSGELRQSDNKQQTDAPAALHFLISRLARSASLRPRGF